MKKNQVILSSEERSPFHLLIVKKILKYKNIFIITFEVQLIIPIKEDIFFVK